MAAGPAVRITMRDVNDGSTRCQIWNGQRAWFWFVTDARWNGAAIGAAVNEEEAVCEARALIHERSVENSRAAECRIQR